MKDTIFGSRNITTWLKLFLLIAIPLAIGISISLIICQYIIKPLLMPILVESGKFGFTADGLSYLMTIAGVCFGFIFLFLIPLFQGYLFRVIRSDTKPSTRNIFGLFFSGWRVNIVCLFYLIPMIIIYIIYAILYQFFTGRLSGYTSLVIGGGNVVDTAIFIIYLILQFITLIFVALFAIISLVHVARGASYKEAFKLKKIKSIIKQIGWYNYILCIVICAILILLISILFLGIGMGFEGALAVNIIVLVIYYLLLIPISFFCTRYLTRVYDVGTLPVKEDTEDFDNF
ncbi:MAG TPA: DUF4013 domain-containing protein [Methanocorpusculum sp.]|nr:DUF4013 domain-containing protein [Methanocorpusculum sp.]